MNFYIHGEKVDSALLNQIREKGVAVVLDAGGGSIRGKGFGDQDKLYMSGENALKAILDGLGSDGKRAQIQCLKDKLTFRKLISPLYPNFKFCRLDELEQHLLGQQDFCIVKPRDGFFGLGVQKLAYQEFQKFQVPNPTEWMVEECIPGDEYSVDLYYDSDGDPVIVNICHHPEHSDSRYSNTLYYTSQRVFDDLYTPVLRFFSHLKEILNLRSFPIHAEFKWSKAQGLIPIELNPLRFGGFGLAELPLHAFGFNPVEMFFLDQRPDWQKIWSDRKSYYYGWVLRYNPSRHVLEQGALDHVGFQERFRKILHYKEIDFRANPVCGIAYVEENSVDSLFGLLNLNFELIA